jgi:hypothetical protein
MQKLDFMRIQTTVLQLLILFLSTNIETAFAVNDCSFALRQDNTKKVISQFHLSLLSGRKIVQTSLSPEGTGHFWINTNSELEGDYGRYLYKQFPSNTNLHINSEWFDLDKHGTIIKRPVLFLMSRTEGTYFWDQIPIRSDVLEFIDKLSRLIRNQINASLPYNERIEIKAIGFVFRHEETKDFNYYPNFYRAHIDHEGFYLRALVNFYGPGTYFWPHQDNQNSEILKQGSLLVFEGSERQKHLQLSRPLLKHQVPLLLGSKQGRFTLRIDFERRKN